MPRLLAPVALRWAVPDELADLLGEHPYRLHLLTLGSAAVSVELQVLPRGTIPFVPIRRCTCCPEHGPLLPVA